MHINIKLNRLGTTNFTTPILLKNDVKYQIALRHGVIKKSWHNISASLGNNTFTYNAVNYTLTDGNYDIDSLQEEIQILTASSISFRRVRHIGKIEILNNSSNPLILQGLSRVLGFTTGATINANSRLIGTITPDFSGGVHELELHCDLVDGRFMRHQGRTSNHLKSIVDESSGHSHIRIVEDAHYVMMREQHIISSITIELRNHDGEIVNPLDDLTNEFVLEIKPYANK